VVNRNRTPAVSVNRPVYRRFLPVFLNLACATANGSRNPLILFPAHPKRRRRPLKNPSRFLHGRARQPADGGRPPSPPSAFTRAASPCRCRRTARPWFPFCLPDFLSLLPPCLQNPLSSLAEVEPSPVIIGGMVLDIHAKPSVPPHHGTTVPGMVRVPLLFWYFRWFMTIEA
jgi:hypothetical protein